jgi:tRNA A-37 threonylcarbamoyl transferase component Bud32
MVNVVSINVGLLALLCVGVMLLAVLVAAGCLVWWLVNRKRSRDSGTVAGLYQQDRSWPPKPESPVGSRCPVCGSDLPVGSPQGLCPRCLLQVGIEEASAPMPSSPPTDVYTPGFTPQTSQELAAAFPHLEILELIGKGGMGAVYKARQPHLDRFVALKILPPDTANDSAFAERFSREARALARLSHPNIVAVHDFGQSGGLYYLLMEYVDGVNLRQAMRSGRLTPQAALQIVPQLCDALQFAHDEGIVHRDIKPENILLDKRGRVKVADFGLAKLLGQSAASTGLTGTQQVMGTLHYMAPEQLAGARAVDHRADIYSLGVTFYEMLTGELPVGRFPPPSRKADIDMRLDDVVLRTLEHEPAQRYQHASDVKTEVELIARQPSLASGSSVRSIATPHPFDSFWNRPQPGFARWVGIPSLIGVGLYLLLTAGLIVAFFLDGAPLRSVNWIQAGVLLCGCPTMLIAMFGVLNLVWAFHGRKQSMPKAGGSTINLPAQNDRLSWWRRQPLAVRRAATIVLFLLMLVFAWSCFSSYYERGRATRVEIGLIQPWFVWESDPGGVEWRFNILSLSAGSGVLALICLQMLIAIYRAEKQFGRHENLASNHALQNAPATAPITAHHSVTAESPTAPTTDEGSPESDKT